MSEVRKWIINIIVIVILSTITDIIMPSGKMKKYARYVLGLITLIIIIQPIINITKSNDYFNNMLAMNYLSYDKDNLSEQSSMATIEQQQELISIYKNKLQNNIKNEIIKIVNVKDINVAVEVDEDKSSKTYGFIKSISITSYDGQIKNDSAAKIIDYLSKTYKLDKKDITTN